MNDLLAWDGRVYASAPSTDRAYILSHLHTSRGAVSGWIQFSSVSSAIAEMLRVCKGGLAHLSPKG